VVDEGVLEDGFAGAGFAQDQAEAALLSRNPEDVQDLLLRFEQREFLGIEGIVLETEVGTNHKPLAS
jgi:hypothetical protein